MSIRIFVNDQEDILSLFHQQEEFLEIKSGILNDNINQNDLNNYKEKINIIISNNYISSKLKDQYNYLLRLIDLKKLLLTIKDVNIDKLNSITDQLILFDDKYGIKEKYLELIKKRRILITIESIKTIEELNEFENQINNYQSSKEIAFNFIKQKRTLLELKKEITDIDSFDQLLSLKTRLKDIEKSFII